MGSPRLCKKAKQSMARAGFVEARASYRPAKQFNAWDMRH
jgi:hypothetical protein